MPRLKAGLYLRMKTEHESAQLNLTNSLEEKWYVGNSIGF